MSRPRQELTATSFAVLGLLALGLSSAYGLVREAEGSLRHFWPRAERKLYDEPKRLEALGLVVGREERTGRRVRTVYEITEAGRRALAEWFARPSAPAQFESEAVLKASLGDLTSKERLLQALREARAQAEGGVAEGRAMAQALLARDALAGPGHAGRVHVVAVMYGFVFSCFEAMARWARWAEEEVGSWSHTSSSDDLRRTLRVFRRALRRSGRLLPPAADGGPGPASRPLRFTFGPAWRAPGPLRSSPGRPTPPARCRRAPGSAPTAPPVARRGRGPHPRRPRAG